MKSRTKEDERKRLFNEVEVLRKLDHPNILKVFEFFEDEKYFYIVTELCTGGELFDQIIQQKKLSEQKAADIIKQIL